MIVAVGDSITAGQYLADGEMAWPALLKCGDHEIVSAGVSNDTTRLGLERFPSQVQELKPDAVIIQFGSNDANRWQTDLGLPRVSLAAYSANLTEMVDRTLAAGATPFLCTIVPSLKSMAHARDVALYNDTLMEVARTTGALLIDVRNAWIGSWAAEPYADDLLMEDGIHPTAAGHRLYAKVVQEALNDWSKICGR